MITIDKKEDQLVKLFSHEDIQERIKQMAQQVNKDFAGTNALYVVGVLKGAAMFASDMIRYLNVPVQLEFIRLSSYGDNECSSGKVKPVDLTLPSLEGKDVLVIEDIVDTGLTATFLVDYVKYQHKAKNVKFASLLDKKCARTHDVSIDYVGFEIDNKFVVGYGMDYRGFYRNLAYIGYFPN